MTLGNAAAAHVRLIVWCKACAHRSEPDPANHARWFGPDTTVPEWRARLVCSKCGDDAVLAVDQDRGRKAELADAAGDLRDLRLGMRPRVAGNRAWCGRVRVLQIAILLHSPRRPVFRVLYQMVRR
jgi:hypothetical protein